MVARCIAVLSLVASAWGLRLPATPTHSCSTASAAPCNRRRLLAGTAALVVLSPLQATANTEPMLDKPMEGFEAGQEKRDAFLKKQKEFKKAWRKELSNLEFASNDQEATEAVQNLYTLINKNGLEIPQGVRKMDLDQVRARATQR